MNLTDERRTAILDEVRQHGMPRGQREFEFTRKQYQERHGLTLSQAQGELERMVKAESLKSERAFVDGKWPWVYWQPHNEPDGTL